MDKTAREIVRDKLFEFGMCGADPDNCIDAIQNAGVALWLTTDPPPKN